MKDEEMAEEYCNHLQSEMLAYTPENPRQQRTVTLLDVEEAFLAGLKASRPQWHDINDTEPSKEQFGKKLLIKMKSVVGNTDYDYLVYKYTGESIADVSDVIAWKEIEND